MKKIFSALLASLLFVCLFSACGKTEPVVWKDEKFRQLVYDALEKDYSEEITAKELDKITQLCLIKDEKLFFSISPDIRRQYESYTEWEDGTASDRCSDMSLSDLANFRKLTNIIIAGVDTPNIHFTADMPQLVSVYMHNCNVQDISGLVYCENLEQIGIDYGGITDISALAGKEKLNYVSLSGHSISDISPLKDMNLQRSKNGNAAYVDLSFNLIADISPLLNREYQLSEKTPPYNNSNIDLSYNRISDLTPFEYHNHICSWNLEGNLIEDVTPLLKVNAAGSPDSNWNNINLKNNPADSFYNIRRFTGRLQVESHKLENPKPVEWQDKEFARMLALRLGKDADRIFASDLRGITNLYIMGDYMAVNGLDDSFKGANLAMRRDYNDYFVLFSYDENGREVTTPPQTNGSIKTLADLANFPDLVYCMVSYQQIEDLDMPKAMPSVETLVVRNNRISDISGIANFPNVRSLYLSCNSITDIWPLGVLNLPAVHTLDLKRNSISEIGVLRSLDSPGYVNLMMNRISDVSPLEDATLISALYLDYNNISDISFLEKCRVNELHLQGNPINDYSYAANCQKVYGMG